MGTFPWPIPQPPDWRVDWDALDRICAWIPPLKDCPQDPVHHAEGNVWIHTRMVAEAMASLARWRALPEPERELVFSAAILHDLSKPATTRTEPDGRITAKGHSRKGEIDSRVHLWELNVAPKVREQISALIRYHQIPFFLVDRDDAQRVALTVSQTTRCDHLALLTEADARGRICADLDKLLVNIELFREYCAEQNCLEQARPFGNDHSRITYFRTEGRDPDYVAHDDTWSEVVMLSGLPASGKDTWLAKHGENRPVVSLDDLRKELGEEPGSVAGSVIAAAEERCREFLRAKRPFIFNATNLSRELRGLWLNLFHAYHARVRIVYVEASAARRDEQNRARESGKRVPEGVIKRMLSRWEVPDLTEAHAVEWVLNL
jgi:putative nucleotidyltransferase with HDIG domain